MAWPMHCSGLFLSIIDVDWRERSVDVHAMERKDTRRNSEASRNSGCIKKPIVKLTPHDSAPRRSVVALLTEQFTSSSDSNDHDR